MPIIYLDVLIAVNFLIDYLLLSAVARVLRHPCKRWRMVCGALIGGGCACAVLLPPLPFLAQMGVRLVTCAMMTVTAFSWNGLKTLIKRIAMVFLVSALFAGVASALWFYLAPQGFCVINGVVYYQVSPLLLTALCVVCYGAVWVYDRLARKHQPLSKTRYEITLRLDRGDVTLEALLDTGHHATEVFSGSPVVMVSREAVENHLFEDTKRMLDRASASSSAAVAVRLRLIPCQTVGGTALLPAICPVKAEVSDGCGKRRDITGCYAAICDRLQRGDYQALIGNDIADLFT